MMTPCEAARIVTMLDEPELLLNPGEVVPTYSPEIEAEARKICAEEYNNWFSETYGQLPN